MTDPCSICLAIYHTVGIIHMGMVDIIHMGMVGIIHMDMVGIIHITLITMGMATMDIRIIGKTSNITTIIKCESIEIGEAESLFGERASLFLKKQLMDWLIRRAT